MHHLLRYLFFVFVCRPLVFVILGLNVRRYHLLKRFRPCIIVANHNSHLDTIVLMTILPLHFLPYTRPVAAEDYFFKNQIVKWFSTKIIKIVPLARKPSRKNPLSACSDALNNDSILIFFPEGTRGNPEQLQSFKKGIEHLAKRHPDVPIIPVYMHGLGKSLPKGEPIFVPFFCDVFVGEPLCWKMNSTGFMATLDARMKALVAEGGFSNWD